MNEKLTYASLGGGVQSSTIAEMVVEGVLPRPDIFIFADTGDEPQYVYDQIDYLAGRLRSVNVELATVSNGNLSEAIRSAKSRFASIPVFTVMSGRVGRLKRQCTHEYKIEPIERQIKTRLVDAGHARRNTRGAVLVNKGVTVEAWIGISLDEVARMKASRTRWIKNVYPLIDLRFSRFDCQNWLKSRGLPVPGKSSCRVCPYHNDKFWRDMRDNSPTDWEYVQGVDQALRNNDSRFRATAKGTLFLHRSCIPLADVDLRSEEERGQMRLFEDDTDICDGGYCFI